MEGDRKRQQYLGRESPALLAWIESVKEARPASPATRLQRSRLCDMLAAGGAATESAPMLRVLSLLAAAGVFRMGGILVGTQAFGAYGNMLGVRFAQQALRTQDIDIAQDRSIGIALSSETATARGRTDVDAAPASASSPFPGSTPGSRAPRSRSAAGI